MKNRYRIVRDNYEGYEAQVKYWWFPFRWRQLSGRFPGINSHYSIEGARKLIQLHRNKVVEYID